MAPRPAAGTIISGLILLFIGGPVVMATWFAAANTFFLSEHAVWAAFTTGTAVGLAGLGMLVAGIRRAIARREYRLAVFGPVGPLAGRTNLNQSVWPSEQ